MTAFCLVRVFVKRGSYNVVRTREEITGSVKFDLRPTSRVIGELIFWNTMFKYSTRLQRVLWGFHGLLPGLHNSIE